MYVMLNNTDLIDFNKYANYSRLQVIKPNRELGDNSTPPTHTHGLHRNIIYPLHRVQC